MRIFSHCLISEFFDAQIYAILFMFSLFWGIFVHFRLFPTNAVSNLIYLSHASSNFANLGWFYVSFWIDFANLGKKKRDFKQFLPAHLPHFKAICPWNIFLVLLALWIYHYCTTLFELKKLKYVFELKKLKYVMKYEIVKEARSNVKFP